MTLFSRGLQFYTFFGISIGIKRRLIEKKRRIYADFKFVDGFLHQERKQCLEFVLPKPGEICNHLACAYNSAVSILFEGGEGPLQIEFINIATK
jgi:hypothetical protein